MRILVLESGSMQPARIRPHGVGMRAIAGVDSLRKVHAVVGGAAKAAYQLYAHFSSSKANDVDFFADFSDFTGKKGINESEDIMNKDYDIIFMNSLRDAMIVDGYLKTHNRTKAVYTDRGNAVVNGTRSGAARFSPKIVGISHLLGRLSKWLTCYVAITMEQEESARRFFGPATRISYIPIAPDPEFRRLGARGSFDGAMCVGRLDERQKKVEFLIKGIANVVAQHPELGSRKLLRIYGSGPDERRYRNLVASLGLSGCVGFMGFARGEDLVRAYNDSGFLVSTSEWESPGRAFLEAMACGIPVLINERINAMVSKDGKRVVSDGKNGLLYKYGDLEDFSQKFYSMYSNQRLRKRLAAGAYSSSSRFSLKGSMRMYDKIASMLYKSK